MIITIVGIDGAGKTTHARWLARWLTSRGVRAAYFQNPGGRPFLARVARRFGHADGVDLLGRYGYLTVEMTVRWFAIARAVVWSRLLRRVAVMDRYSYCQYVMMRVRGDRGERLARTGFGIFPQPDLSCLFLVDPGQAQQRVHQRGTDTEELDYLCSLDATYRSLPDLKECTVIDANGSSDAVRAALCTVVAGRLNLAEAEG